MLVGVSIVVREVDVQQPPAELRQVFIISVVVALEACVPTVQMKAKLREFVEDANNVF